MPKRRSSAPRARSGDAAPDEAPDDEDYDDEQARKRQRGAPQVHGPVNGGSRGALAASSSDSYRGFSAGMLVSVHAMNFMCHHNLYITFGPKVNFINGRNGSGKSSVVAALQTALGARASETNRGKSAASLIRHGYDGRAVVRIILFNDGPDKFRPDMFPDRFILVERQIMRSGQTQYKIMSVPKPGENATGTVVSTERSLVLRLADYFSIQVHNPLVIMTQEDTKQMVTGSAEEKFKFFAKAGQFMEMQSKNAVTQQTLKDAKASRKQLKRNAEEAEVRYNEAKKAYNKVEQALHTRDNIERVDRELFWSSVPPLEKAVEEAKHNLELAAAKKAELEEKIRRGEAEVQAARDAEKAAEREVERLNRQHEQQQKRERKIREERRRLLHPVTAAESELAAAESVVRSRRDAVQQAQAELDQARREKGSDDGGALANAQAEVTRKQDEIRMLEQQYSQADDAYGAARDDLMRLEQERANAQQDVRQREQGLERTRERLRTLQSAGNDRVAMLDPHMPRLNAQLKRERWDAEAPVGPLGRYVSLRPEGAGNANALDMLLRNYLKCYVVRNAADGMRVREVARKAGVHGITTLTWDLASPSLAHRKQAETLRRAGVNVAMDFLRIEHDAVEGALAVHAGIERHLVFQSSEEAEAKLVALQQRGVAGFGRGLVGLSGSEIRVARGAMTFTGRRERAKFLRPNPGMALSDARQDVANQERELPGYQRALHDMGDRVAAAKHNVQKKLAARGRVDRRRQEAQEELQLQRDRVREEEERAQVDLGDLEGAVTDAEGRLEDAQRAEVAAKETLARAKQEMQTELGRLNSDRDIDGSLSSRLEAAVEDLDAKSRARQGKDAKQPKQREIQVKLQGIVAKREKALRQMEKELENMVADATRRAGDRPERIREVSEIRKERRVLDHALHEMNQTHASIEQIRSELADARANKRRVDKFLRETNDSLALLSSGLEQRRDKGKRLQRLMVDRMSGTFNAVMNRRGHTGVIGADFDEQTLTIRARMNGGRKAMSDLESMSGGERSHVNLSLILSVSVVTDCRFRVMDEPDVFMDTATRSTGLRAIVDECNKSMIPRQFIVVTPLDVSEVGRDPSVRISRLMPPQRHQGTLTGAA